MHPEVIAAPLERVPEGVTRRLRVARLPELDPLLIVQFHLVDAPGMYQLEIAAADPGQAQATPPPGIWPPLLTSPGSMARRGGRFPPALPGRPTWTSPFPFVSS